MKNVKNAKTELEKRLEEELLRESESAEAESDEPQENEDTGNDEVIAAEVFEDEAGDQEPSTETLEARLAKELDESKDQLLRMRAEFDNYRKRMARESERMRKRAAESLLLDLLPVLDNLELALQHADDASASLAKGVAMVAKQLSDALAQHGLSPIQAIGHPFDPRIHEAVSQIESKEFGRDVVALEFQKGYMLGEQVLRASKVAVSIGEPNSAVKESTPEGAADHAPESEE